MSAHSLTVEQQEIVRFTPNDGTKVLINAFAGCAKTTTAREIVKRRRDLLNSGMSSFDPKKRFIYLVFNRDAEMAAKNAFYKQDKNAKYVHVRTHHSLALKFFIEQLRHKILGVEAQNFKLCRAVRRIDYKIAQLNRKALEALGKQSLENYDPEFDEFLPASEEEQQGFLFDDNEKIDGAQEEEQEEEEEEAQDDSLANELPLDLESDQLKPFGLVRGDPALEVLDNFCREQDDSIKEPQEKHVKFLAPLRNEITAAQQQVLQRARKAWCDSINGRVNPRNGRLIVSHEVTLKYFCLLREESESFIAEKYHTILFDEAQDIDVILMSWIEKACKFACYLIGDGFQSIYNFKGAFNAMAHLINSAAVVQNPLKMFYLSQSFRFGKKIADIANSILQESGRFAALNCNARLSAAPNAQDSSLIYVSLPSQSKRPKMERILTRHDIVSQYIVKEICNEANDSGSQRELTVISRKNNTLLTLAIDLASQGVYISTGDKLTEKLKQGALVLSHYVTLEHIDGRVEYLQTVMRSLSRENALSKMYETFGPQEDAARASGQTPWFYFVRPLSNCGDPKFASITSRVCDQVLSELHILQVALHMRDLNKTKQAIANLINAREEDLKPIQLFTVHAAKGGEWQNVLLMDDFPDLCTLICALKWCASPAIVSFQMLPAFDKKAKQDLEKQLKTHVLQTVPASCDRDDAVSFMMRTLSSAKSCTDFITALNEELHLYYVAVTRSKKNLYIGVSVQRFRNEL